MSRIIAGALGGRRITAPPGRATRPTADRVREALFSSLATLVDLDGCRFADLYAGSGAVGIESLSRGAAYAWFVESDPRTARVLKGNLAALGVADRAEVVVAPVAKALAAPARQRVAPPEPPVPEPPTTAPAGRQGVAPVGEGYDVIFADPPYELPDAELSLLLEALVRGRWLAPHAVVVVERATRSGPPGWVPGLTGLRTRRYGETTLWYGRAS